MNYFSIPSRLRKRIQQLSCKFSVWYLDFVSEREIFRFIKMFSIHTVSQWPSVPSSWASRKLHHFSCKDLNGKWQICCVILTLMLASASSTHSHMYIDNWLASPLFVIKCDTNFWNLIAEICLLYVCIKKFIRNHLTSGMDTSEIYKIS